MLQAHDGRMFRVMGNRPNHYGKGTLDTVLNFPMKEDSRGVVGQP